jgi:hypothetical protein
MGFQEGLRKAGCGVMFNIQNVISARKSDIFISIGYIYISLLLCATPLFSQAKSDQIEVKGTFLGLGIECAQFKIDSGEQISLTGIDLDGRTKGDKLLLKGIFARGSKCMQGRTLIVVIAIDQDTENNPNTATRPH